MRSGLLWLAVLLLVAPPPADCAVSQSQYDAKHGEADDYDEDDYEDDEGGIMQHWHDAVGRVRQAVDAEGLMRARRWGNVANGLLLGITGPVTLAVSLIKMRLSDTPLEPHSHCRTTGIQHPDDAAFRRRASSESVASSVASGPAIVGGGADKSLSCGPAIHCCIQSTGIGPSWKWIL